MISAPMHVSDGKCRRRRITRLGERKADATQRKTRSAQQQWEVVMGKPHILAAGISLGEPPRLKDNEVLYIY
jgi:hypothetical protein